MANESNGNNPATGAFAGAEAVETNPDWAERYERSLAKPGFFRVVISYERGELTGDEIARMNLKLQMVENFASNLAMAMLKGTYKYPSDTRTPEQWQAFFTDEFFDLVNYRLLADAARAQQAQNGNALDASEALDMHEIARRNGFRLEGDKLIQVGY